ncbi:GGDEF domain-containing protein [Mycolicibacterium pyrenivorans]|uniref:GGDEF domain-containing protein n=1 Tax=Mycolicibacterium pyrenivorans TaxID=187102 RepID=UPI0021F2940D|nr:sensor domain-containing diguanylate cyclase [Mycolicibacterium pyrenivorans]
MRARGVLRVHQVFIGGFSLMYGLTALLTVLGGLVDGGPPGGRVVVLSIAISSAVLGVIWILGPWPTERGSAVFALYADVAVFAVIAWCQDAFTAMPGLALLATNGIYIVIGHGPRALLAHLVFTVLVFGWFYVLAIAQGETSAAVVTVRLLVLLPTVVGVPVIVHSYLLTLRMGAVDALIDPLTRLLNRRGLDVDGEELVLAGEGHVSVLAVDIDKFKTINDSHGHDAGDRVLVAVANAVRDAVSTAGVRAVIARTGGEEFVVVIDAGHRDVLRVAGLVHDALARCDAAVVPTVSIGAATGRIEDGDTVRELIERADTAMYRAKNAGGNRTVTAGDAVAAGD